MPDRRVWLACAVVVAGCTVVSNDDPFGAATAAPATTLPTTVSSTDASASESGSSGASTTGDAGTGVGASTGAGMGTSDGGEVSSGGLDGTTAAPPDGTQPDDGMYSSCSVPEDCGFAPMLCITVTDMQMMLLGGFCSQTPCSDPVVDCLPSPGGTAVPTCMPVTVNDVAQQACALDCTGGKTCPPPMQCYPLAGGSVCA